MRLITPYAPGSFLMPCVVVSTVYLASIRETALVFVEALNAGHALSTSFSPRNGVACTDWILIQRHEQEADAIAYHLALVAPFKNGGSDEEWSEGWEPYLALYERWCPVGALRTGDGGA